MRPRVGALPTRSASPRDRVGKIARRNRTRWRVGAGDFAHPTGLRRLFRSRPVARRQREALIAPGGDVIADLPDNTTAAAVSLAVGGTGLVRIKTAVLLTPDEVDRAAHTTVGYRAPGK